MAEVTFRKGDLLVAAITLSDPNFDRSVVLLCDHQDDAGTYGLILNRPVKTPEEVTEQMPYVDRRLFEGGPVRKDTLQVLHPYGEAVGDAAQVLPGVWVGGDFEALHAGFSSGTYDPEECLFLLGYSGWAKNQLAAEFELETWLQVRGSKELVFQTPPDKLWSATVRKYGKKRPLYSHYPEDPKWN